jgi:hypothetical protein
MDVIRELNEKLDKLIKLDPSQYATSAALLYLKVDGAIKKIEQIHRSFTRLETTVLNIKNVLDSNIPRIADFVQSRNMEGMEIIADEV